MRSPPVAAIGVRRSVVGAPLRPRNGLDAGSNSARGARGGAADAALLDASSSSSSLLRSKTKTKPRPRSRISSNAVGRRGGPASLSASSASSASSKATASNTGTAPIRSHNMNHHNNKNKRPSLRVSRLDAGANPAPATATVSMLESMLDGNGGKRKKAMSKKKKKKATATMTSTTTTNENKRRRIDDDETKAPTAKGSAKTNATTKGAAAGIGRGDDLLLRRSHDHQGTTAAASSRRTNHGSSSFSSSSFSRTTTSSTAAASKPTQVVRPRKRCSSRTVVVGGGGDTTPAPPRPLPPPPHEQPRRMPPQQQTSEVMQQQQQQQKSKESSFTARLRSTERQKVDDEDDDRLTAAAAATPATRECDPIVVVPPSLTLHQAPHPPPSAFQTDATTKATSSTTLMSSNVATASRIRAIDLESSSEEPKPKPKPHNDDISSSLSVLGEEGGERGSLMSIGLLDAGKKKKQKKWNNPIGRRQHRRTYPPPLTAATASATAATESSIADNDDNIDATDDDAPAAVARNDVRGMMMSGNESDDNKGSGDPSPATRAAAKIHGTAEVDVDVDFNDDGDDDSRNDTTFPTATQLDDVDAPKTAASVGASIPVPSSFAITDAPFSTATARSTTTTTAATRKVTKKKATSNNDNFVRLNLKNAAGSCRGARSLKRANKAKLRRAERRAALGYQNYDRDMGGGGSGGDDDEESERGRGGGGGGLTGGGSGFRGGGKRGGGLKSSSSSDAAGIHKTNAAGVDPLDDYLDGVFRTGGGNDGASETTTAVPSSAKKTSSTASDSAAPAAPRCARHQRPCKLLIVKKNTKGNKGRKFYACSMPRGEQCDHFQWEDDTAEAAKRALLRSSSMSGFVARQVAAYGERFKVLTLPELRDEAKRRNVNAVGKKNQVLTRLLIWVRDEIARSVSSSCDDGDNDAVDVSFVHANDAGTVLKEIGSSDDDDPRENDTRESCALDGDNVDGDRTKNEEHENNDVSMEEEESETSEGDIELDDSDLGHEGEGASDSDSDATESSSCDDELEFCGGMGNRKTIIVTGKADDDAVPANGSLEPASPLHASLKNYFGYESFRDGQLWAIRRCLAHQRTLLVAPTGQGKSLCYALPAALMDGVCLVVSPLISLMQDQLRHLPPAIPAATLSGSLSTSAMATIVDDLLRKRLKILFVSPERLCSAAFRRLIRPKYNPESRRYERQLPQVSLLCVDEAHCLSQWGHNFRPSYLRLRSLLPMLEPKSVLALTATAGPMVIRDICNTLRIPLGGSGSGSGSEFGFTGQKCSESSRESVPKEHAEDQIQKEISDGGGVKVLSCNRDNIDVATMLLDNEDQRRALLYKILKESDNEKKQLVLNTLSSNKKKNHLPIAEGCLSSGSVIVYVWRQKDTEIVAEQLIGAGVTGGVVFYHGGMDANARSKAQAKFMRGKARICVATVAFGLGINKPDIVGVIHLCLPPSPEHYLQEIGRAGRDGRSARAIALVVAEEVRTRHSLAHSDKISESQLMILFMILRSLVDVALEDIFGPSFRDSVVDEIDVALPLSKAVEATDCKGETIETILSLLEDNSSTIPQLLSVEGTLPDQVTITLKRRTLQKMAANEDVARCIEKCGVRLDSSASDEANPASNSSTHGINPLQKRLNENGYTAIQKGFVAYSFGTFKFSVVQCARLLGPKAEPRHVYAALRRLQSSGELELLLDMTSNGRAIHLKVNKDGIKRFRSSDVGDVAKNGSLHEKSASALSFLSMTKALAVHLGKQEKTNVEKVEKMHEIIHRVASEEPRHREGMPKPDAPKTKHQYGKAPKSPRLVLFQSLVQQYFLEVNGCKELTANINSISSPENIAVPRVLQELQSTDSRKLSVLSADVDTLTRDPSFKRYLQHPVAVHVTNADCADYRALCISKILHGIDAPRAPIMQWYSHPLWGKWRGFSFGSVLKAISDLI